MQVSKIFIPELTEAIESADLESLQAIIEHLHPSDIADILDHLTPDRIAATIKILGGQKGFRVFEQLELPVQANVLTLLGREEIVRILEELSPDDRVDLLQRLPEETVDSLLPFMAQAEREDVRKLLQYEENTAGAIMTTEYAALTADTTVSEALTRLRTIAPDSETIYYVYIVDASRELVGAVSLRDLVLAKQTETLENIMFRDPVYVDVAMDQEEVAKAIERYDLLAIPVVDLERRLVGIVTYDDALDVIVEEQTEDAHRMGAVGAVEDPYFLTSFWKLAQQRGLWLLVLLFGGFFAAMALSHYQKTFQNAIALVFFVPLIVSAGGNSGSQSVTLITRGLAVGDVRSRDFLKVLWRESAMGITLGLFLGLIGFLYAVNVNSEINICLAVGLALICVVVAGSVLGAVLPLLFKQMGFDPALMSSPLVASIVDVVGIVIYFTVAQSLLNL